MAIEVRWTKEARRRVAPEKVSDIDVESTDWTELLKYLKGSNMKTQDPAAAAALARVAKWPDTPPEEATVEEIGLVLALFSHTEQALAERFGAELVARALSHPALQREWSTSDVSWVLVRKASPPNGHALRELVVRAPSKQRDELRASLEDVWESGDAAAHAQLAYAFFFYEPWRLRALEELESLPYANEQLALAATEEEMRRVALRAPSPSAVNHVEIVARLGASALPLLMEMAPKIRGPAAHATHMRALSVLVCEEVARHFAARLTNPAIRHNLFDWFEKNPDLAKLALPAEAEGASRNAALAKALLVKIAGPADEEGERASLDDPAVPEILRAAPWRVKREPWPKTLALEDYEEQVTLSDHQKKADLAWLESARRSPEMTTEEARAALARIGQSQLHSVTAHTDEGVKSFPLDIVLELVLARRLQLYGTQAQNALLAAFGAKVLPALPLTTLDDERLRAIDSPRVALALAHVVFDRANPGAVRWSWFRVQPRAGAYGLMIMLGHPEHQHVAELALRLLARTHRDVVLEVAKGEARVRELLDRDARLDVLPALAITIPEGVTRPKLRDGRALDDDATKRVLELVSSAALVVPDHPGFAEVKDACDPQSLAAMAWDLAALADGKTRSRRTEQPGWMRWPLLVFANDAVIRRLTPALKHPQIYRTLELLALHGSAAARVELATAHVRGDPQAERSLTVVAGALGVTNDELVLGLLPATALDAHGATTLSYGVRELRVGFDTTLTPFLFDGDKRLASLPRAKKSDDPIAVRLAKERWEELKEDVRTIATLRYRVLEESMRGRARISSALFLTGWARHPLGTHLARGMIWATERGGALVTFRVAEDCSLASVDDDVLELADDELVFAPHPLDLDRATLDRWTQIFSDYGVIQPVAQLGRSGIAVTPEEAKSTVIERVLSTPPPRARCERLLQEHGFVGWPPTHVMRRALGAAHIQLDGTWGRKGVVNKVQLTFTVDGKQTPWEGVDPIERAEAAWTMRQLLEIN